MQQHTQPVRLSKSLFWDGVLLWFLEDRKGFLMKTGLKYSIDSSVKEYVQKNLHIMNMQEVVLTHLTLAGFAVSMYPEDSFYMEYMCVYIYI